MDGGREREKEGGRLETEGKRERGGVVVEKSGGGGRRE